MVFFLNTLSKKKVTHLYLDNVSYLFFKLKNLVFFRSHILSYWLLEDNVFFIELNKNKISFLFFQFFCKYINKVIALQAQTRLSFFDAELEMQGLGFEIYKITERIYRFFCGYVNYIYLIVPSNIEIVNSTKRKKKIWIRAKDVRLVNNFVNMIKLLKGFSAYRAVGFYSPRELVRLRSGKKK